MPALDSFNTAIAAGIAGVCETKNGTITFWAEEVPEQNILMHVTLLGQANTDTPVATTSILGRAVLGKLTLNTGG